MAALTAVEQTPTKLTEPLRASRRSEPGPEDPGSPRDFVVDFLGKEVGSDLKSLKNVGDLLKRLREENSVLEEQVITASTPHG